MSLRDIETNARSSPVSGAQIHRPNSVEGRGLPHQERVRLKKLVHKMRFGTLNVGSMTGRSRAIADLMRMRRVDVLCVQETRWSGNKAKELGEGYKLIYGSATNKKNGVGIILAKELKDLVIEVNRKSDRIIWLKLAMKDFTISVFSVYAPQTGCSEEEKAEFWASLQEEYEKVEDDEKCIVNGDLNGHIGETNEIISRIHGGNYFGGRNEQGETVIDFALSNDLAICNTLFKKRPEHLITYKSGNRASQIDLMMYRRRDRVEIQNCKVIPGDHVTSQHRLVVIDLIIKVPRTQTNRRVGMKRIKWFKLKEREYETEYKDRVMRELVYEIEDIEEWWNRSNETMLKIAKEVLGESSGKIFENKEAWWFSEEIRQKTKEKKEAKKTFEQTGEDMDLREYKQRNKEVKKAVAIAKAEAYDQLYSELDTNEGKGKIFRLAKQRLKSTRDITHIRQIKDESGNVLRKEKDVVNRWKEYFENLLNEENERVFQGQGSPHQGLVRKISKKEIVEGLKRMKTGKAPGPDNLPVEAWKALGSEGVDILWNLMDKIFNEEKVPEIWRQSTLIPIFKEKGDIQECKNYRGIKLMSHTLKLFERIMDRRMREEVQIGRGQLGFMKGVGTTDGIFTIRQMMEKCREKQQGLHMAFIDLEKAYDRIPREEVWLCLRKRGVPEKYVRLVQETYRNATTRVRSAVGETDSFTVGVGLHQGSALSPFIFNIVFDVLTEEVRENPPWCVLYADDVILVTKSRGELEAKLERWRQALESRGMRISRSKTEYMTTDLGGNQEETIQLEGSNLKRVTNFKYLGSVTQSSGDLDREIAHRVQSGWNNWRKITGVVCDRRVPIRLKGKIHKAVVRPALMYGLETAPIKKTEERKLDVAEMKMLRWMSGVTKMDRVRNEYIRGSLKVAEVSKKIQEARLRWYGHVMRSSQEQVAREAMDKEIEGRRKRGRPKTRWKDRIEADLLEKGLSGRDYENRTHWRRLIRNSDPE